MNHFPLMARFNEWANTRLYGSVEQLPEAAYREDRRLFFGSIHRTLNHLLLVDRLWTRRIEGIEHGFRSLDQVLYDDFASLRQARSAEDRRLIAFIDSLDADRLARVVRYRRMIGQGMQETRTDHILLTLFNHQTHHRGQVHAALTQAGIEPPPLDVIYFLDEVEERTR